MSQESDWRLQSGGGPLVEGRTFTWKLWHAPKPSWDHDHCELCGQKLTDLKLPDSRAEGYADECEYYWLCAQCALDFRDTLHLRIVGGPAAI